MKDENVYLKTIEPHRSLKYKVKNKINFFIRTGKVTQKPEKSEKVWLCMFYYDHHIFRSHNFPNLVDSLITVDSTVEGVRDSGS